MNVINKKIIITGGCGFIGSNLADELVDQGAIVSVIDIADSVYKNNKIKYYKRNIQDDAIDSIFEKENPNIVIHLAAQTSVATSIINPKLDCLSNIYGTLNIIENCKKYNIQKLIVASSAAVYGTPQYLPVDEKHPLNPLSYYGLSKKVMEEYVKMSDLNYVIFRFSNVYGPRQSYNGESGVVSIFINNLLKNKDVVIYGNGDQYRDFIYVKDIVDCIVKSIDDKYKKLTLNVSTETKITITELCNMIKLIVKSKQNPIYKKQRIGDIKESILCNKRMLSLGFKVNTPIEKGLEETVYFSTNNE